MGCPFKIPVAPIESNGSIVDAEGNMVLKVLYNHKTFDLQVQQLNYAAKVINSHEKLEETIFEVARQAIAKYDINAPPLTKNRFANEFVDSFEQAWITKRALEEAEKQ